MEIKKSPKADLEKGKTLSILMGFVVGLAVLFVGFEWSTRDVMVVQASEGVADIIAEEEVEITRPENTPPPPPPPPAPVVTEVLNVVEDDVELEQQDILSSEDDQTSAQEAVYTPPAVVEEEEESAQQIFTVVEEMPKFPGGDAELLKFIAKSIKYPVIAQENGIQGRVICAFVVNRDGSVVDAEVLRGVDPSLDKEALRVIGTMPKWTPGISREVNQYVLSILCLSRSDCNSITLNISKGCFIFAAFFYFITPLIDTAMLAFENILQRIESEISQLQFTNPPKSLYEPIEYILSLGGKRIRPALTLMACNIYNNSIENAIKPALGLEVFHNFTLLHDDLMDEADKRRNKPTVHKVWNANTAILSGDAMLIAAYLLIGSTEHGHLKQVLDLFTQTAAEICGGQQFDMEFESRMDVSEEEYIEMIRLKTAVLLACSLKTGALLGGASQEDASNLYAFGINIGLAFQLQDDLLDVYGDTATFGKNIGGDILCNKKTFLLINALRLANKEQVETLRSWMDKKEFDPAQKIQAFTSIYNELQLKQLTENKIQAYYDASVENLNALQVAPEKLTILKEVCDHLMHRQS